MSGTQVQTRVNPKEVTARIRSLGRAQQWPEALALVGSIGRLACQLNPIIVSAAVSTCIGGPCWFWAVELLHAGFGGGIESDVILLSAVAKATERGKWQMALAAVRSMTLRSVEPGLIAHSTAISAAEKSGAWRLALGSLGGLRDSGIELDTVAWNAAIGACSGRHWPRAVACLAEMPVQRTMITFNHVLGTFERDLVWESALALLRGVRAVSLLPDRASYSAALRAGCPTGLLDEMRGQSLEMDLYTYNNALGLYSKQQLWGKSLELVCEMQLVAATPETITYNTAISACSRAEYWEGALEIAHGVRKRGPSDLITLNAAITAAARGSQATLARSLLSSSHAQLLRSDLVTYSAALEAFEKDHRWLESLNLYAAMRSTDVDADLTASSSVMSSMANCGFWAEALQLMRSIRYARYKPDLVTFNAAVSATEKGGSWDIGLAILARILLCGVRPSVISYNAAILGAAQKHRWSIGLELFDHLATQSITTDINLFRNSCSLMLMECEQRALESGGQSLAGMLRMDGGVR